MARLPDPTATLTGKDRAIYDDILARRRAKGVDHLGPYIPLLNHPQLATAHRATRLLLQI